MRVTCASVLLALAAVLPAQQTLLGNLSVLPNGSSGTDRGRDFVRAGSSVYFRATGGRYLHWITDGTRPGTRPIASFGTGNYVPFGGGDRVLMTANLDGTGRELWQYDGATLTGSLVKEVAPGPDYNIDTDLVEMGGYVYFGAQAGEQLYRLWRSDGTASGTVAVADLPLRNMRQLMTNGSLLFFEGDLPTGDQLWRSDGTQSGSFAVANAFTIDSMTPFGAGILLNLTSQFSYCDGSTVVPLGTTTGEHITDLTTGHAVFVASATSLVDPRLWRTDGTVAGTVQIATPPLGSSFDRIGPIERLGDFAIVGLEIAGGDKELFRTDGTDAGTYQVADINPGNASSNPSEFVRVEDEVWFVARTQTHGNELYRTDGTPEGTEMLLDLVPGPINSDPNNLAYIGNGRVICNSRFNSNSQNLTITDGTYGGTYLLASLNAEPQSSLPRHFAPVGSHVVFQATDLPSDLGTELFVTDGTPAGTELLADLNPGFPFGQSNPRQFESLGDTAVFVANGTSGMATYVTDGTAAGTALISTEAPEGAGFTRFGDLALFSPDGTPWLTDGTALGTQALDTTPHSLFSIRATCALGDRICMAVGDGVHGIEPWVTDGTNAGTQLLADTNPGSLWMNYSPIEMVAAGGRCYFVAWDVAGGEVWSTDGTPAATQRLVDLRPGPDSSFPQQLVAGGGEVFFTADDGTGNGRSLWRTDSATNGVVLVLDVPGDLDVVEAVEVDGGAILLADDHAGYGECLFFVAPDGSSPTRILDLGFSGYGGIEHDSLTSVLDGTMAAFVADDLVHGNQLWVSNGTVGGTMMISELGYPGVGAYSIEEIASAGDSIYASVWDRANGSEPWRFNVSGTSLAFHLQYGEGCQTPGSPELQIGATSQPVLGDASFGITLNGPDLSTAGILMFSYQSTRYNFGACQGLLLLPVEVLSIHAVAPGITTTAPLPLPNDPALAGGNVFWQWAVLHPDPEFFDLFNFTGGLQTHLGY